MTTTDQLTAMKNSAREARRRVHTARMKLMSGVDPSSLLHDLTLAERDLDSIIKPGEAPQATEVA